MSLMRLCGVNVKFEKRAKLLGEEQKIHVLKDIDLELYPGEILALVGESGCGKTTTGKVITGLLPPTEGAVFLEEESLYRKHGGKDGTNRLVQFVQQDSYAALNPVKTIRQSLTAALRCVDKKIKGEALNNRLEELMECIGLTPAVQYLDKYPHNLSGGQRQRILMARAIAFHPKIIVADEPVSMIDVSLRLAILNLMKKLNQEMGITVVYITHDLSTARYIAKNGRICVMYLGEIVELGEMEHVLTKPRHPYTQALIKAVPDVWNTAAEKLPLKSMELSDLEKRKAGCAFANRCPYETEECARAVPLKDMEGVQVRCVNACKI